MIMRCPQIFDLKLLYEQTILSVVPSSLLLLVFQLYCITDSQELYRRIPVLYKLNLVFPLVSTKGRIHSMLRSLCDLGKYAITSEPNLKRPENILPNFHQ